MHFKFHRIFLLTNTYPAILVSLLAVLSIGIAATAKIITPSAARNSAKQFEPMIIKAKQDEAKNYISAFNKAQQAYYIENGRFTANLGQLGVEINPETNNYSYKIAVVNPRSSRTNASAKDNRIRSYVGAVFVIGSGNNTTTITAICETNNPSKTPPAMPRIVGNNIQCAAGSRKL